LVGSALLFLALLFARLSHPLLWNDEGETAMYAERILEFGYPKVHDGRNVVYEIPAAFEVAVKQPGDAYVGSPWGQYYFGALGAALARSTDDPYEKTFLLRLPFALAGAAGIAILAGLLIAVLRPRPRLALGAAAVFVSIEATSFSLLLHLREARYYAIAVLLVAASLFVRLVLLKPGRERPRLAAQAGLAALLVLLFNVFSAAWLGLCAALGIDALRSARGAPPDTRTRTLAWGLLPVALAALLVLPCLWFFDTLGTAARITGPIAPQQYVFNLAGSLLFLLRYDVLLPALLARAFVLHRRRLVPGDQRGPGLRGQLEAADLLAIAIAMHLLAVARVPFLFERYLIPVSPLVAAVLVLDVLSAADLARVGALQASQRGARRALVAVVGIGLALVTPWRLQDLAMRVEEIVTPYRGPLDFAIERLRARYPDPGALVIATNYESTVLMYYLRSRVIVGFGSTDLAVDRALVPDVVIPRRQWDADRLGLLAGFLDRAEYEKEVLPVADLPYNNIPEVSIGPGLSVVHQRRTPAPSARYPALELHHRVQPPTKQP
jgi:hypothetical protein